MEEAGGCGTQSASGAPLDAMSSTCIRFFRWVSVFGCAFACSSPSEPTVSVQQTSEALSSCSAHGVQVSDLHADFRDIWAGREVSATGKQADPLAAVTVDFNTTVDSSLAAAQFVPDVTDGSCGAAVAATGNGSVVGQAAWGPSSDTTRPVAPGPYNLIVRESISGVVSAAGAIAAGGDINLSSFNVNATARQPIGMIAGGKVTLTSGFVQGNVTFGAPSTLPGTVTVSGTKTQQAFSVASSFDGLEALSSLLAEETATASAQNVSGTLTLSGTKSALNVFSVTADVLQAVTSVKISVPSGAGVLVNVTGANVSFVNAGFTLQGATNSGVLWNLPSAGFVRVSSVGLPGSLFAPGARVSFESGSISGTVVARNFQSPGAGSLLSAPLNLALLAANVTPSALRFSPAKPLVRGCSYRFVIPSTQPLVGTNCLATALSVDFHVAAHPSSPADRELANTALDPNNLTLRRFEARTGINTLVADIWARYESTIGVSRSALVASGASRTSSTRAGQLLTSYQQYYQGYPIAGFGYLVATESGIFRSADGKVAPSLPSTLPTPISASAALQAALQALQVTTPPWVSSPTRFHAPVSLLELLPKQPSPSAADFVLVWHFGFAGTGLDGAGTLDLEAGTGHVLLRTDSLTHQTLGHVDTTATYQRQTPNLVDTLYGTGQRTISAAQYQQTNGSIVTTLASGNMTAAGILATVFQPPTPAGGSAPAAQFVTDPTPATPWTSTEPIQQAMATGEWGLERSLAYLQAIDFHSVIGGPAWTSVDGTGHRRIVTYWKEAGGTTEQDIGFAPDDSDADTVVISATDGTPGPPVEPGTFPHEFSHALVHYVRDASQLDPTLPGVGESGSLKEGIADLNGAGAVHAQLGTITDWSCAEEATTCLRDVADPTRNSLPVFYKGTNYQIYSDLTHCEEDSDYCFVHENSTVISHWGYLLAFGTAASPAANPCGISFDPLDPNPDVAMKMVLNIAYLAAGTRLGPSASSSQMPTFADLRDQTLSVTRDLVENQTLPADALHKLELAWYAVGVGPDAVANSDTVSATFAVNPPDDGMAIYPWVTFEWPASGNGQDATSWDFQIADGPFDTNLLHEESSITSSGGKASFALALPFDSTKRYFWRVRPHDTTQSWLGCYPVHTFVDTTTPGVIQSASTGLFPGTNPVSWTPVDGAIKYEVFISETDNDCSAGSGVIQRESPSAGVTVTGLQPDTHYFLEILPVGPNGTDGTPSTSSCFKAELDTPPLRAPSVSTPVDTQIFDYGGSNHPVFGWTAYDAPDHYLLQLYPMDASGKCGTLLSLVVPDACDWSTSDSCLEPSALSGDVSTLKNPAGYCWNVVAVAKNGGMSPQSDTRRFYYTLDAVAKLGPGKKAPNESFDEPNSLGKNSYASDVNFSWTPEPGALDYVLEVGPWPWVENLSLRDPTNCVSIDGNAPTLVRGPFTECPVGGSRGDSGDCTDFTPTPDNLGPFFDCDLVPAAAPFVPQVAKGSSTTLDGKTFAEGRYCWQVYSELEDPANVGQPSPLKPLVQKQSQFCYTSGPSTPAIEFDNKPAPNTFSSAPVTGHVTFDYVPDGQFAVEGSPEADIQFDYDDCKPKAGAVLYNDYFNCVVNLTITPHEQTTYTITARTWASDQHPPLMDASSALVPTVDGFTTPACGAAGQACCDQSCDDSGDVPGAACVGGVCTGCGALSQACCPGNECEKAAIMAGTNQGTEVSCQSGTCAACGNANQVCCPTGPGVPACPGTGVTNDQGQGAAAQCVNNHCAACGHNGQPCCVNPVFQNPICEGSLVCNAGTCSGEPVETCNEMIHSGGNTPETHVINLGKTSGTVNFAVDTFEVPDDLTVTYDGKVLIDTGCFGSNLLASGCSVSGWCCNGESCYIGLKYSGASTEMTVSVTPNCQGTDQTGWEFLLTCP